MACFEPTGDVLLLFGGGVSGYLSECWKFDGSNWSQLAGVLPPHRSSSQMVYDSVRQRLVLFGGNNGSSVLLQDTWEWNGSAWLLRNPGVSPPAREYHAMAFDRRRGVTVLFSGFGASAILQDLWEWNGTSWIQRIPAGMPLGRNLAHMCFDPASQTVLLSGGEGAGIYSAQSWSWDGNVWLLHQPATPPTAHIGGRVVADLHRNRVVLHGGDDDWFSWEWSGSQWDWRLQVSPGPRDAPAMAYDPMRRRVVLFGGNRNGLQDDTWIYRTPLPADVVAYGTGCAGTAGTPQLTNAPYNLPWLGDTVVDRVSNIAVGEPGAVFVSSFAQLAPVSLATFGMPGCSLLLPLDVVEFRAAVAGVAEWTLAIPNIPVLAGVPFYQQAFPFDAAANPRGLTASNGLVITPGIR